MTSAEVAAALKCGKPDPPWQGEPLLGGTYGEAEIEAAVAAIRSSMAPTVGFGFSAEPIVAFERAFAEYVGCKHAITLNSAGPGLDMLMRWLKLEPGDEVIVPAINFQAAPLAVYGAGGQVVWGEVREDTLQLDPDDVAAKITARTRAVFPVHFNGLSAPMDELRAAAPGLPIIGDAARACGGEYKGCPIGKHGRATVFSFHTMKNMSTLGEGGMVTTDDDEIDAWCRAQRFYGAPIEEWGTSNVMTKVQAAVGLVQLGRLQGFIDARHRLAEQRDAWLADVPEITRPVEPADCRHSYYLYTVLVDRAWAGEKRDRLVAMLNEEYGAGAVVANRPVYATRRLLAEHTAGQRCPRSDELGERLLCLAIHPAMSDEQNAYVTASLCDAVGRVR